MAAQVQRRLAPSIRNMLNNAMLHSAMRSSTRCGTAAAKENSLVEMINDILSAAQRIIERGCPEGCRPPPPPPPTPPPSPPTAPANNAPCSHGPPPCFAGCCAFEVAGKQQVCYGHGECESCHCRCVDGWKGACCNVPRRECPVVNGMVCGKHGVCLSTQGICRCDQRWTGDDCGTPTEICPDDFRCAHGQCNADGRCDCEAGYTGDDCSLGPFFGAQEECPPDASGRRGAACAAAARNRRGLRGGMATMVA